MSRPLKGINTSTWSGRCAARIRELRERRFASQGAFVAALRESGLTTIAITTVSSWETGGAFLPLGKLPAIAGVLGVSVRVLLPKN